MAGCAILAFAAELFPFLHRDEQFLLNALDAFFQGIDLVGVAHLGVCNIAAELFPFLHY